MTTQGNEASDAIDRILVRGTNWIGDSVMSLAALREIRRLNPESHLTLLVRDWVAGLFEQQGLADEIVPLEEGRLARAWKTPPRISGHRLAVLFQNAFEAALLSFLARIPDRVGYATDGRGPLLTRRALPRIRKLQRHQVYYYLDLLYQTGLSPVDYLNTPEFRPDIGLRVPPGGREGADRLLRESGVAGEEPLVALNPGAYFGPAKRWFTDRYAVVADRLARSLKARVFILGHAGETRIAEEIRSHMQEEPVVLTGRTDLPTLLGLLARSRLLITNDSGPMHLAAALDVPQVALFGSTDEQATGPYSSRARVIHKHVECSPCLLRECPIDLRCFDRIEVDEVVETAVELLR